MTSSVRRARAPIQPARLLTATWRIRQLIASTFSSADDEVDEELRQLVANEAQWELLARLTAFDRAHHLRVRRHLNALGHTEPDLLHAALLHDVGKADERGRAGVAGRSLRVLLRRMPRLLDRLTTERHPRILHGLYLANCHARLGAELARAAGASEYCCLLIALHEDCGASQDPLLAALVVADNAVIR